MIVSQRPRILRIPALVVLACATGACTTLGPDYARPDLDVPASYRYAEGSDATMGVLMVKRTWKVSTLVLANNGCFVIFSSTIAAGPSSAGAAFERVAYFSLAGLFVTVAMYVAWGWFDRTPARPQPA